MCRLSSAGLRSAHQTWLLPPPSVWPCASGSRHGCFPRFCIPSATGRERMVRSGITHGAATGKADSWETSRHPLQPLRSWGGRLPSTLPCRTRCLWPRWPALPARPFRSSVATDPPSRSWQADRTLRQPGVQQRTGRCAEGLWGLTGPVTVGSGGRGPSEAPDSNKPPRGLLRQGPRSRVDYQAGGCQWEPASAEQGGARSGLRVSTEIGSVCKEPWPPPTLVTGHRSPGDPGPLPR